RLENRGANFIISRVRATGIVSIPPLFWLKSEVQLTNLSLCFQSHPQMGKVELSTQTLQLGYARGDFPIVFQVLTRYKPQIWKVVLLALSQSSGVRKMASGETHSRSFCKV